MPLNDNDEDLSGHIVNLKKIRKHFFVIAGSGSTMSTINEQTAQRLQNNDSSAKLNFMPPSMLQEGNHYPKKTIIYRIRKDGIDRILTRILHSRGQ